MSCRTPVAPATHPCPLRRRWLGSPAYWACQAAGWGALVALWILPVPLGAPQRLAWELGFALAFAAEGLLLSHLWRVLLLRLLARPRRLPWLLPRLAPAVATLGAVYALRMMWLAEAFAAHAPLPPEDAPAPADFEPPWVVFFDNYSLALPLLAAWTALYLGLRAYRRHRHAEADRLRLHAALKDAELRALKAQLDPHFLFNSLNTVRALIAPDNTPAREALTRLSNLLRASLARESEPSAPLSRELKLVDDYLALEHLRHESRLRVERRIAPETLTRRVPVFLLQTLVENALKHGIARTDAGGLVEIEARLETPDARLVLAITNPGHLDAPPAPGAAPESGLGLRNARARLAVLHGPAATLVLEQIAIDRVRATATLPAA